MTDSETEKDPPQADSASADATPVDAEPAGAEPKDTGPAEGAPVEDATETEAGAAGDDDGEPAIKIVRDFLVAACFWTWLPLPLDPSPRRAELGRSRYMFPLIGILLGLLPAFVFMLAIWLHLNPFAAAIAALVVMLGLTGGRAEIATASILEALCRSGNRDTRVKILAETRPGYYGMFGLILLVLAKLALLGSVVSIWHGVGAILAAAAVSRGITAVATWFADSMDGDRIAGLELEPGRALVWIPAVASVLLLVPLLWFWSGLVAIPLVIVATGLAFVGCRSAFGGLPVYSVGLLQQVAEVTILLAAVAHF